MSDENKHRPEDEGQPTGVGPSTAPEGHGPEGLAPEGHGLGASAPEGEAGSQAGAPGSQAGAPGSQAGAPESKGRPNVEELARRVEALAKDDDELDRIARQEEARLAQRREAQKKGSGKKSSLEEAAAKRLAKIGAAPPKRVVAASSPAAPDALLQSTQSLSAWARRNAGLVRTLAIVGVVGVAGALGYGFWKQRRDEAASAALEQALLAQRGRIGDPGKADEEATRVKDPTPVFKTADERREAALKSYQEVAQKYPGTGPGILARLAEAALLLDKRDAKGALDAYKEVRASALAEADKTVRGRALEGEGFAHEMLAQMAQGDASKASSELDAALSVYKELAAFETDGFKELGQYHEARVYEAKGDKDKAKELLKTVYEKVSKPGERNVFPFLVQAAEDRLRALDPQALPARPAMGRGGPGGQQYSPEQIQQLLEMMKKQQGGAPPPGGP